MSSVLYSVDPGVQQSYFARWVDGKLTDLWVDKWPDCKPHMRGDSNAHSELKLAVEVPRVYRVTKSKGDPNDLIDLTLVSGRLIGSFPGEFKTYYPYEWKRQMKKEISQKRCRELINVGEFDVVKSFLPSLAKSLHHNMWDAIGIGLHAQGRCLY